MQAFYDSAQALSIRIANENRWTPESFINDADWKPQVEEMNSKARIIMLFHYGDPAKKMIEYIYELGNLAGD